MGWIAGCCRGWARRGIGARRGSERLILPPFLLHRRRRAMAGRVSDRGQPFLIANSSTM